MKKLLIILIIAVLCVGAYFLFEEIKVEPEKINLKPEEKVETNEANDEIEIIDKNMSIERRFSRLPYEYPEYPKTEVPENFKLEVHTKFIDWIENNVPPLKNAEFANWEEGTLPKIDGEISFYKTRSTPVSAKMPENWKISSDEKSRCVLYLIFPPYENDLLNEYWIKFVIHLGSEGRVWTWSLRNTERSGFVWKFAGQSVE